MHRVVIGLKIMLRCDDNISAKEKKTLTIIHMWVNAIRTKVTNLVAASVSNAGGRLTFT